MRGVKPELIVKDQLWSGDSHRDSNAFYNEQQGGKPDTLTNNLTYLLGDYTKMYPLSTMQGYANILDMERPGSGATMTRKVKTQEYDYPVMGRFDKAAQIAETPAVVTPAALGAGHSTFTLYFTDNWLKRYQLIESESGIQAYVQQDPIQRAPNKWEYKLELNTVNKDASCPVSEVQAGTKWVALFTPVSFERSRGSDSNTVYPGKVKNQLGFIRKSATWGAKHNLDRVMNFNIKYGDMQTNMWMSWFMYQFELSWMKECEHAYWYSRYNRDYDSNVVTLTSAMNGEKVPMFSGILEQIGNYATYSQLSYDFLQNQLTNAYFGLSDGYDMDITLHTGTGGMREFDRAMRERGATVFDQLGLVAEAEKFIEGTGRNLALTGFFDAAYFIDGHFVKVKKNPIFDMGQMALKSKLHPVTGLPLESYRMVFIDNSNYDGNTNLQFVELEGMPYQHMVNLGFTDAPKDLAIQPINSITSPNAPLRNSDIAEGSYHRGKSLGIQLLRANKCLHFECTAA